MGSPGRELNCQSEERGEQGAPPMLGSRLRHLPAGLVGLALGALLSIVSAAVALAGGGPSYP